MLLLWLACASAEDRPVVVNTPVSLWSAQVEAGDAALASGDLSEASKQFTDAVDSAVDDEQRARAQKGLGRAKLRQGDPAAALGALDAAVGLYAGNAEALTQCNMDRARAFLQLGKAAEATKAAAGDSAEAKVLRARAASLRGNDAAAWKALEPLLSTVEGAVKGEALREAAVLAMRRGHLTEALQHADAAVAHDNTPASLVVQGMARARYARAADAKASYEAALAALEKSHGDAHPWVGAIHHDLASLHVDLNDFASAEPHCAAAQKIRSGRPELAATLRTCGWGLKGAGKSDEGDALVWRADFLAAHR